MMPARRAPASAASASELLCGTRDAPSDAAPAPLSSALLAGAPRSGRTAALCRLAAARAAAALRAEGARRAPPVLYVARAGHEFDAMASAGVLPAEQTEALANVHVKYVRSEEELRLWAAAVHLADGPPPAAIVVDDFGALHGAFRAAEALVADGKPCRHLAMRLRAARVEQSLRRRQPVTTAVCALRRCAAHLEGSLGRWAHGGRGQPGRRRTALWRAHDQCCISRTTVCVSL